MVKPIAECPKDVFKPVSPQELASYFSNLPKLKHFKVKDRGVLLSDLDPELSDDWILLWNQNRKYFLQDAQGQLHPKDSLKSLSEKDRQTAQTAATLWANLETLRQKISPPSETKQNVDVTSLNPDQAKKYFKELWGALQCAYGNEALEKIFPQQKLKGGIIGGDSLTQAFAGHLIFDELGCPESDQSEIGVEWPTHETSPRKDFFLLPFNEKRLIKNGSLLVMARQIAENLLVSAKAVYPNPKAQAVVIPYPGQVLDGVLNDYKKINPFFEKPPTETIGELLYPRVIRQLYPKDIKTHLDFLTYEFKRRIDADPSSISKDQSMIFRLGLTGNNLVNVMFDIKPADLKEIQNNLEDIAEKTKWIHENGGVLVFNLPPELSILLSPISLSDGFYDENGKSIEKGYTFHSWWMSAKYKETPIPKNAFLDEQAYQRLQKSYQEIQAVVDRILLPKGWIVLHPDNQVVQKKLQEGFRVKVEGFGFVERKGPEDFFYIDRMHPSPMAYAFLSLHEAELLHRHGIAVDSVDRLGSKNYTESRLQEIIAADPHQWLSNSLMPIEKVLDFKKRLTDLKAKDKNHDTLISLRDLMFEYWSYFDREILIQTLDQLDSTLKSLEKESLEKALIVQYQEVSKKEGGRSSKIEGGKLQEHQLARIIRWKMIQLSPEEEINALSTLIPLMEKHAVQKEEAYWKCMDYSMFYLTAPDKPSSIVISAPVEFSAGTGPKNNLEMKVSAQAALHSQPYKDFQIQPIALSASLSAGFSGNKNEPSFNIDVGASLQSCLYHSGSALLVCGKGTLSHALLGPKSDWNRAENFPVDVGVKTSIMLTGSKRIFFAPSLRVHPYPRPDFTMGIEF